MGAAPLQELMSSPFWISAGWCLVHTLWIGGFITALALVARRGLARAPDAVRSATALGFLLLLGATPIAVFLGLGPAPSPTLPLFEATPAPVLGSDPVPGSPPLVAWLPWFWLTGVGVSQLWLALGLMGVHRLRTQGVTPAPPCALEVLHTMREELDRSLRVGLLVSSRIAAPVLVGVLRPTILLPARLLSGLTREQLELVFLHELAHLVRRDGWIQLLQRLVESWLFFHPGVWLISHWLSEEREHSCDTFVLCRRPTPRRYAEILLTLAETPGERLLFDSALVTHRLDGAPLVRRIRKILDSKERNVNISPRSLFVVALCVVLGLVTLDLGRGAVGSAPTGDPRISLHGEGQRALGKRQAEPASPHTEPVGKCSNCHAAESPFPNPHPHHGGTGPGRENDCSSCHVVGKPRNEHSRIPRDEPPHHVLGARCTACHEGPMARPGNTHPGLDLSDSSCRDCHATTPRSRALTPHPADGHPCPGSDEYGARCSSCHSQGSAR